MSDIGSKESIKWQGSILRIAIPSIFMNLSIPLLSAVDTAVAGHFLSAYQIGAIGLGSLFYNLVFWLLSVLRMSTVGWFARLHSQKDEGQAWVLLVQAASLGLLVGFLIVAFSPLLTNLAGWWVESSPRLETDMKSYLEVRLLAIPAAFCIVLLQSWFFGKGRVLPAVTLVIFANILNAGLDFLLVGKMGLSSTGLAWAAVFSQCITLLLGLIWFYKNEREQILLPSMKKMLKAVLEREKFKKLIGINANLFVRTLCLQFSILYLSSQAATFGEITLAAFTIGWQLTILASYLLDGFAHAAEVLTGQAIGLKKESVLRNVIMRVLAWGMLSGFLITLSYGLLWPWWQNWFTNQSSVLAILLEQLPWILLVPIIGNICFSLDGIFIGASAARHMRNSMLFSTVVVFLPLTWLLGSWFGIHGLWASFQGMYIARAISLGIFLRQLYPTWVKSV